MSDAGWWTHDETGHQVRPTPASLVAKLYGNTDQVGDIVDVRRADGGGGIHMVKRWAADAESVYATHVAAAAWFEAHGGEVAP